MAELEISCSAEENDIIRFREVAGDVRLWIKMNIDETGSFYLTKDTARQVFNWLGAYLHRP